MFAGEMARKRFSETIYFMMIVLTVGQSPPHGIPLPADLKNVVPDENPVFVYAGDSVEKRKVMIPCVPLGQKPPIKPEMYEWRRVDHSILLDSEFFQTNDVTGDLFVTDIRPKFDGRYYCTVIGKDNQRITYAHSLISVMSPNFHLVSDIRYVTTLACDSTIVNQTLEAILKSPVVETSGHFQTAGAMERLFRDKTAQLVQRLCPDGQRQRLRWRRTAAKSFADIPKTDSPGASDNAADALRRKAAGLITVHNRASALTEATDAGAKNEQMKVTGNIRKSLQEVDSPVSTLKRPGYTSNKNHRKLKSDRQLVTYNFAGKFQNVVNENLRELRRRRSAPGPETGQDIAGNPGDAASSSNMLDTAWLGEESGASPKESEYQSEVRENSAEIENPAAENQNNRVSGDTENIEAVKSEYSEDSSASRPTYRESETEADSDAEVDITREEDVDRAKYYSDTDTENRQKSEAYPAEAGARASEDIDDYTDEPETGTNCLFSVKLSAVSLTATNSCVVKYTIVQSAPKEGSASDYSSQCKELGCVRNLKQSQLMQKLDVSARSLYDEEVEAKLGGAGRARVEQAGLTADLLPESYKEDVRAFCLPGYKVHLNQLCIPCSPGTLAMTSFDDVVHCIVCPYRYFYQSSFHATKCNFCPIDKEVNGDGTLCKDKTSKETGEEANEEIDMDEIIKSAVDIRKLVFTTQLTEEEAEQKKLKDKTGTIVLWCIVAVLGIVVIVVGLSLYRKISDYKRRKKAEEKAKRKHKSTTSNTMLNTVNAQTQPNTPNTPNKPNKPSRTKTPSKNRVKSSEKNKLMVDEEEGRTLI